MPDHITKHPNAQQDRSTPNPWAGRISVAKLTPTTDAGAVRAYADVQIGSALVIHGCKVIGQAGRRLYVRLPDRKDGDHWFPVVSCSEALQTAISERVLDAYNTAQALGLREDGA